MNKKRATIPWRYPASWETVCRRASGRRRYNAWRKLRTAVRRRQVAELLVARGGRFVEWGVQAEIARQLGVHRSTVSRDIEQFLATVSPPGWRLTYSLLQCLGRPVPLRHSDGSRAVADQSLTTEHNQRQPGRR